MPVWVFALLCVLAFFSFTLAPSAFQLTLNCLHRITVLRSRQRKGKQHRCTAFKSRQKMSRPICNEGKLTAYFSVSTLQLYEVENVLKYDLTRRIVSAEATLALYSLNL